MPDCVYPFGFDPKWFRGANELVYFNSFKMKHAIIVGVIHMTVGIVLKAFNNLYTANYVDFIFEWIPQIIFMTITFGYLKIFNYSGI